MTRINMFGPSDPWQWRLLRAFERSESFTKGYSVAAMTTCIHRITALRPTEPNYYHGWQRSLTSHCCYLSTVVGRLYRILSLCHLWAEFVTTCRTTTNMLILVAVWWLIYAGEMEVNLQAFLFSARFVGERWASIAGLFKLVLIGR